MGCRIFIAMVVVLLVCLIAQSLSFQAGNLGCGGLPKRPLSISIGNHGVGVSGTHGGIHAGKQHNQKNIGGHLNLPGGHTIHADHVKTHIPDAGNIHHTTVGASGPIGSGTYTVGGSKTSGAGMPVQRSISAAFEKTNRNGVSYKIEAGKDANSGKFGKISVNIPFN